MNHPGIYQIGRVTDDGTEVHITGWGLTYCERHCHCHDPLRIDETRAHVGMLGIRRYRTCDCCVAWTADELAAICRDLAPA